MTIGTATVARTSVLSTLGSPARVSPKARLITVRVGKTATQIIRASWCLVGGGTDGVCMECSSGDGWLSDGKAQTEPGDRDRDVLLDEVVVDRDGRGRPFAGRGDDLGAWVGGVAGGPDPRDGREAGAVGDHPAVVVGGASELCEQVVVGHERGADEHRRPRNHVTAR